jgi:peptidylprolyl isomerase
MSTYIAAAAAILIFIGGYFMFFTEQNSPSTEDANSATTTDSVMPTTEEPVPEQTVPAQQGSVSTSTQTIMKATFKTSMGDISIALNEGTPKTVENFVTLAQKGFYDGTKFHRVIAGFMNQGGDPLSKDDTQMARWGTGGPGYQFADEIVPPNNNAVGTISMANAGPNTNGSQFFINVADNTFLNTKHTVFGKVVAGMDVVTKINGVDVGPNDRPLEPVVIQSIVLE